MSFLLDEDKTWVERDFGLDRRLVKALSKLGYIYPTLVQARCIPIALQGKDLLVRARTGSGKTVAFSLPLLHKLLASKAAEPNGSPKIQCLVLAPTKELCKQIERNMSDLIYYCKDTVAICALMDDNTTVQQFKLQNKPDIIISTPARLVQQMRGSGSSAVDLSHVKTLVIDEADLVLSFGYTEDVHTITSKMPKIFQGLLMSATLSPELDKFKRVLLHNPAVLRLEEEKSMGHLLQFFLTATEADKYLVLFVFIKLGLLQGKGLIFVNDVSKCYKLKLFLQQFFISAAVLNSQVPLNSRMHMIEEYNRGVFDYLIATDASIDMGEEEEEDEEEEEEEEEEDVEGDNDDEEEDDAGEEEDGSEGEREGPEDGEDDSELDAEMESGDDDEENSDGDDEEDSDESDSGKKRNKGSVGKKDSSKTDVKATRKSAKKSQSSDEEEEEDDKEEDQEEEQQQSSALKSKKAKGAKKQSGGAGVGDADYGVSRGIDFQGVNFVINFDFPKTAAAYTHRIGRTARGGASGTALSFVTAYDPTQAAPTHKAVRAARVEIKGKVTVNLMQNEIAVRDAEVLQAVRMQQPRLGTMEGDNILAAIGAGTDDFTGASNQDEEARMQPAPLNFNMAELESFRYRVEDIVRAVTPAAVKEFRTAELKREILNSSKLKSHFAENPNDLKVLRHDKAILHPITQKDHLKFVPEYLIPQSMRSVANSNANKKRKRKRTQGGGSEGLEKRLNQSKKKDPLVGGLSDETGGDDGADAVGDAGGDDGGDDNGNDRVFTTGEIRGGGGGLGRGMSGRQQWKLKHKKGKFNPKSAKKNEHRVAGSFVKSKKYK